MSQLFRDGGAERSALAGRRVLTAIGLSLTFANPSSADERIAPSIWMTDDSLAAIRIERCGEHFCGFVVWVKSDRWADGERLLDRSNPDPAKRSQPICGLQIIGNLAQTGEGQWNGGWIYDPKAGRTYGLEVTAPIAGRLDLYGYLGTKILGKSIYWTSAPKDLVRCRAAK
jgi:uncharacterized protein (DUF2147 family)